jgi:hypothetical protein
MEKQQENKKIGYIELSNKLLDLFDKENPLATTTEWKVLYWVNVNTARLILEAPQTRTLDFLDKFYIPRLRELGFSFDEIAFALTRSKSTVHDYLEAYKFGAVPKVE